MVEGNIELPSVDHADVDVAVAVASGEKSTLERKWQRAGPGGEIGICIVILQVSLRHERSFSIWSLKYGELFAVFSRGGGLILVRVLRPDELELWVRNRYLDVFFQIYELVNRALDLYLGLESMLTLANKWWSVMLKC